MKADEIARIFLSMDDSIDTMKLHKMMYFAYAWYMAYEEKRLWDDLNIIADEFGPVISELPNINTLRKNLDEPVKFNQKVYDYCYCVYEVYKNSTGLDMANETHRDYEPWRLIHEANNGDLSTQPVIRDNIIKKVFQDKLKYIEEMEND